MRNNETAKQKDISKLMLVLTYLVIWAVAIIVFWCFYANSDALGYSIVFMWGMLPVTTFVVSLFIGLRNYWGNYKWIRAIGFGIMYMLAEYATFSMANNVAFNKINAPEFGMVIAGTAISLIGMGIGHLIFTMKKKQKDE